MASQHAVLEQTNKPTFSLAISVHRPNEIGNSMTQDAWIQNAVVTLSATRSQPVSVTTSRDIYSLTNLEQTFTATYTSISMTRQRVELTASDRLQVSGTFSIFVAEMSQQLSDKMPVDLADSFEKERGAFLQMRQMLLAEKSYRDKYVAVLNGSVVDYDEDEVKLLKRVYDRFGYVPVYVERLGEKRRIAEISTPEIRPK